MAVVCAAITKAGSRCRRPVLPGKAHCLMHDPESAELRREASRKGGRHRSAKARAAKALPEALTPEELTAWLSQAFKSVLVGRMEPKVGTACATLAKAILEAHTAAAQPALADLHDQLDTLRALIERGRAA
jgi:hypothetical protein